MSNTQISGNMIVKNEDQWIYFAINSILPFVDELLITDTGSTDHTLELIRSIQSPKIKLTQIQIKSANDITQVRNDQVRQSSYNWIWLVDGDEIYNSDTAKEVLRAVKSDKYKCIAVRRNDLLGDIYHRQSESVGSYEIFGEKGHLLTRLFNKSKLKDLRVVGDYPNEEYFYGESESTSRLPLESVYITKNYLFHAMYLKRSSLGSNLKQMFNRSKYKVETGLPVVGGIPSVFDISPKILILNPLSKRSLLYELLAQIVTPIKSVKRVLKK